MMPECVSRPGPTIYSMFSDFYFFLNVFSSHLFFPGSCTNQSVSNSLEQTKLQDPNQYNHSPTSTLGSGSTGTFSFCPLQVYFFSYGIFVAVPKVQKVRQQDDGKDRQTSSFQNALLLYVVSMQNDWNFFLFGSVHFGCLQCKSTSLPECCRYP